MIRPAADRRRLTATPALLVLLALASGCDDSSSPLALQYWDAETTAAANRVRLEGVERRDRTLTIAVVVDGPTTSADLTTFDFGIRIGDTAIVDWVAGSETLGTALDPAGCADLQLLATSRPEGVAVTAAKIGCGGNRVTGVGTRLLTFDVEIQREGATTVRLGPVPTNDPPVALDSNAAPIPSITFDAAPITVFGL